MLNDFLARLDNDPTAPQDFVWPSFEPRALTAVEQQIRGALLGNSPSREARFQRALQLADLVANSPLAQYLDRRDSRRTYDRQSVEQRVGVAGTLVQYFGARPTYPKLNFITADNTPEILDLGLEITATGTLVVIGEAGGRAEYSLTYNVATSMTDPVQLPGGAITFTGVAPAEGDQWVMNYRAPGTSWLNKALQGFRTIDPRSIVTGELEPWLRSPIELDRLAATVVALTGP